MLFAKLKPAMQAQSIYGFDFQSAYDRGIRGVILDIDNTLVPHDAPADARAAALAEQLKKTGYQLLILSNNREARTKSFAEAIGVPYICEAGKPSRRGYDLALEKMKLEKEQVLCVGDQLLTDIWGASNAGLESLLVEPLDRSTDTFWIRVKRVMEKPIKLLHNRKGTSKIVQD